MITEVCGTVRNYFASPSDKHGGKYTISGGTLAPSDFLTEGQYFRIIGSKLNDGVYQYPAFLVDETFDGAVWAMNVPPAFLDLVERIKAFNKDNQPGAFVSESFGGYSYTRATKDGKAISWQDQFASELSRYRRIRP